MNAHHQGAQHTQPDLLLPILGWLPLCQNLPHGGTGSDVMLFEATGRQQAEHQQMLRATCKRYGIALSGLYLNLSPVANCVVSFGRRRAEHHAVIVTCQCFPDASNKMAVGREMPAWKHRLKAADNAIKLSDKRRKLSFVHSKACSAYRKPCSAALLRHWNPVAGVVIVL